MSDIHKLIADLRRPMYNYSMSLNQSGKSATTRRTRACVEIDKLVEEYVSKKDLKRFGS